MGLPSSRLGFVAKPEMPPHLNVLFRARPPLEYLKPIEQPKYRHYDPIISDAGNFLGLFETGPPPERARQETPVEKQQRELKEKLRSHQKKVCEEATKWDPSKNPKATMDPYRTLFVARLDKATDEKKLKRVFGEYGPIRAVKLVRDPKGISRNYAFIEFENLPDFKEAYKRADGIKIDGRKILVDYERGRTVPGWKPRRLGGGKGNTRRSRKVDKVIEEIMREEEEDEKVKAEVEEVKLKGTDEFKVPSKESEPASAGPQKEAPKERKRSTGAAEEERSKSHKKRDRSRSKERVRDRSKEKPSKDKSRRDRSKDRKEKKDRRHHDDGKHKGRAHGEKKEHYSAGKHNDEYEPGEIIPSKSK